MAATCNNGASAPRASGCLRRGSCTGSNTPSDSNTSATTRPRSSAGGGAACTAAPRGTSTWPPIRTKSAGRPRRTILPCGPRTAVAGGARAPTRATTSVATARRPDRLDVSTLSHRHDNNANPLRLVSLFERVRCMTCMRVRGPDSETPLKRSSKYRTILLDWITYADPWICDRTWTCAMTCLDGRPLT